MPAITERTLPKVVIRLRLFVYGTLQPAAHTRMGRWIEQRCLSIEPASVPGRLFAVRSGDGWFPALVPARSAQRVLGALCDISLAPGELGLLDRYEGAEYRRTSVAARTGGGASQVAQLYLWRIGLPGGARAIRSGDFLGWLRDNRLEALSMPRAGV